MKNYYKIAVLISLIGATIGLTAPSSLAQANKPTFRALVLAERGDQHEAFVKAALEWMKTTATKEHFEYDVFVKPQGLDKKFLAKYQVFIQLNYPPYRWSDEAKAACQADFETRIRSALAC